MVGTTGSQATYMISTWQSSMKKRTAERAVLLTELNSVIAHRAVETREREEKALSRVRADPAKQSPIQPSPASQQSISLFSNNFQFQTLNE
ncbi:hypothetical protein ACTXT7_009704 [Hymenolepis weldensis]